MGDKTNKTPPAQDRAEQGETGNVARHSTLGSNSRVIMIIIEQGRMWDGRIRS
jgi:hypothetical protein